MFRQFLPTAHTPKPVETSRLNSPRDSSSGAQIWKKVASDVERGHRLQNFGRATNKQFARDDAVKAMTGKMFPFKIYRLPDHYAGPGTDPTKAWRTFRVRAGSLFIDDAENGLFIDELGNSDGVEQGYEDVFFTRADGSYIDQADVQYFEAAEMDITYVWVEIDDPEAPTTAEIHVNINPAADGWDQWPKFDARHFRIGAVDTVSRASENFAEIIQTQYGDIIRPPTKEIEMCDPDTGELINYDVYCFKHIEPTITMDSTKISLDSTKTTMDQ